MYMSIKDRFDKTLCEISIYSKRHDAPGLDKWYVSMSTYFNINNYSKFIWDNGKTYEAFQKIRDKFSEIQGFVKDLNERTGVYPNIELYDLTDKQLRQDELEIIKITRDRLHSIIFELADTGIYLTED